MIKLQNPKKQTTFYVTERFWVGQNAWIPIFDRPHRLRKDALEVMRHEQDMFSGFKFRVTKYVRSEP